MDDSRAAFGATNWSLVSSLRAQDESHRRAALDELISRYWPPVYAYIRRAGADRDAAAELTQGFFTDVALGRRLFERADPAVGWLRVLVLHALKNYLIDEHRRANAAAFAWSLSTADVASEESRVCSHDGRAYDDSPDTAFHRRWAVAQLEEALRRCERRFVENGRERHWRAFEMRELRPATSGSEPLPMTRVAAELGFATPADAAAAVQTVRKRVLATLQDVVAESVTSRRECEEELTSVEGFLGA